jgi:hypothetical protein
MTAAGHSQRSALAMRWYRGTARPYPHNTPARTSGGALGLQAIGMCHKWRDRVFEKLVYKQSYEGVFLASQPARIRLVHCNKSLTS